MKRKGKSTKLKKKKIVVPKSDDSGVSSELEVQKVEEKKKATDKMKISINLEDNQRFVTKDLGQSNESTGVTLGFKGSTKPSLLDGFQSDKSRISFEDDAQSCLDYEPYEEEPEDYIDSPDKSKSPFQPEDETLMQDSYDQNSTQIGDDNNIGSIEKPHSAYEDREKNSEENSPNNYEGLINQYEMTSCDRSSINECTDVDANDAETEEQNNDNSSYWDGDKDDNTTTFFEEGRYLQQKKGPDKLKGILGCEENENCADLFRNAEVNFSGPLNITITRPVINNIESLNTNTKACSTNETVPSNLTERYCSSPTRILTTLPTFSRTSATNNVRPVSQSVHSEKSSEKIQWPEREFDIDVVRITSDDDIFNYNIKHRQFVSTFSYTQSEVSCMYDTDFMGKVVEKESEISESLEYNRPFDMPSDRISADRNNLSSETSYPIQNLVKSPSELRKNSETSLTTSMNPLNVPHFHERTDLRHYKQISVPNPPPKQNKLDNIGSSSSQEDVFRHPLKRPPTRPHRKRSDLHVPTKSHEDEALSILGTSTILGGSSDISEDSESVINMQENDKEEFVNRWLMSTSETDVTQILESLCESHFNSNCDNARCEKSHFIDEKRVKQLSPIKLMELYELSKKKIFWFTLLFDVFIDCFKGSLENGRICLVDLINDVFVVFKGTFIDKTSYISKIVCALQSTGLSFKEAIEYILLRYGTSQISICDILLFIISKESHLDDHWSLVEKVICCRRERLDHDVVINLLNSSLTMYPPDIDLCKKIYNEIFEKNLVDLDKIPESLWIPIRMAVQTSRKLEPHLFESELRDSTIQNDFLLDQNSTRPSASFKSSDDRKRCRIEKSVDAFNRVQIEPYDSASSGSSFEGISEFNKSLLRMKYNQNGMYNDDQNGDTPYYYPYSQVNRPLFDRPVKKNKISITQAKDNSILTNKTSIPTEARPQMQNDDFRNINNTEENELGIFNSKQNYCCNQTRNLEQDLFKIPCGKILKKRRQPPDSRNIRHLANRESQLEANISRKSVYRNEVLDKINKLSHSDRRAATPGSSVAHPSSQLIINSRYECNVSLHNLYPDIHVNATEITKLELLKLGEALEGEDGSRFLSILKAYQNAFTIENIILNTLIFIKSSTITLNVFKKFMSLLNAIEDVDVDCWKNPHIKMVIEVLAMNLIYYLEKKGEWVLCKNILLRIKMKNWHSLVTSKIFFCASHLMSHMCRYIYICEILTRAGDFHWVNEIFQLNTLCLLGPISKWPYQNVPSDLNLRNRVLKLFFDDGFLVNIVAVNDLLNHIIIVNGGSIEGFDVWKIFDDKISMVLDSGEEHSSILKYLSAHIVNYGHYMSQNVLQRYMIFIKDYIEYNESFKLFKICCEKGLYHKYNGNERVIIIRTTMCDFEISSIFECYFENILKRCIHPHEFYIELKLPEPDQPNSSNLLKNVPNRSVYAVYASVINILKLKYRIIVEDAIEYTIRITESMQHFLPII